MTGLRSSELSAISLTKRRVNLSVDCQSCLSPSTFGSTEVTFRTGQFFRMPRCPRTNSDDACDDRCVLVDDGLDSAVVEVDGPIMVPKVTANALLMSAEKTRLLIDANFR